MTPGRKVAAALLLAGLSMLAGTGLWTQFVYDEAPGPHRITIVAPRHNVGQVAFQLDRYPGAAAPASEIVTTGDWTERSPGTLGLRSGGGRASYHGAVDEEVVVRFLTGPDGGHARVVVDRLASVPVSLRSAEDGTRLVHLRFEQQIPAASWFLLALMIAVCAAPAAASVWCVDRLTVQRDARTAVAAASAGTLIALLVAASPFSSPSVVRAAGGVLPALNRVGIGVVAGLLVVLAAALALGIRPPPPPAWVTTPETSRDRWRLTLALGSVPFAGWLALQMLFWPGLMNPDSANQWFELDRTGLDNWHPYTFAVALGLLRHVVDTPALPILLQSIGAALLVGRVAAWTVWRGRTPWVAAASLVLLPVLPPTGLFTVTLWKDTAFGIALLGLALVVWRIEDTKGCWLAEPRNTVLAVVTMLGILLSRHNGWPIVVGTAAVLLVRHGQLRGRMLFAVGAALGTALIVQIPVAKALGVTESRVPSIVYVQHIAMHVNKGTRLTQSDRELLRTVHPLDREWPYSCSSIQSTWSGPQAIQLRRFTDKASELRSVAIRLALRDPGAELGHLACASELIWKPGDDEGVTYFLEWSNTMGRVDYIPRVYEDAPTENPGSPRATARIFDVVAQVLPIWVIRPALYLYALLLATAFAARRRRSWGVAWIAVPVVIQSLVLAAVTLVQDVRLQYGVMLTAVVMVPALLTVTKRSSPQEDLPLRWSRRRAETGATRLTTPKPPRRWRQLAPAARASR